MSSEYRTLQGAEELLRRWRQRYAYTIDALNMDTTAFLALPSPDASAGGWQNRAEKAESLLELILTIHNVVGDDAEGSFQSVLDEADEYLKPHRKSRAALAPQEGAQGQ